jgi:hypothetical protein
MGNTIGGMENFTVEDYGLDGAGVYDVSTAHGPSGGTMDKKRLAAAKLLEVLQKVHSTVYGQLEKRAQANNQTVLEYVISSTADAVDTAAKISTAGASIIEKIAKLLEEEPMASQGEQPTSGGRGKMVGSYCAVAAHYNGGKLPGSTIAELVTSSYGNDALASNPVQASHGFDGIGGDDDDENNMGGDDEEGGMDASSANPILASYTSGGACCGFGPLGGSDRGDKKPSLAELKYYSSSLNSSTKKRLVDDLVDIAKELGVKVSDSADMDHKVENLLKALPDPRKKTFKSDSAFHSKVCKSIARELNKKFGRVIDENADASLICQQVHELIYSLKHGMHVEFLEVMGAVKNILRNLILLKGVQDTKIHALASRIAKSEDRKLAEDSAKVLDAHKLIAEETKRQIEMLKGFLNVTLSEADQNIMKLLKSSEEIPGLISTIKDAPGSSEFGMRLMKIMSETGTSAHLAMLIDKALRTIGMKVSEYSDSTQYQEFMSRLHELVVSQMDKLDRSTLQEFMDAMDLLIKNFSLRGNIEKDLRAMSDRSGGDDKPLVKLPAFTPLQRDVLNRRRVRTMLFRVFEARLRIQFQNVMRAIDSISDKVGVVLPITDALDALRNALSRFRPMLQRKNIYVALVGYYKDALSRERRESFLAELRLVKGTVEACMESSAYSQHRELFRDLQLNLKNLIEMIEEFSDKVAQKYGRGDDEEVNGGDDEEVEGADDFLQNYGGDDDEMGGSLPAVSSIDQAFGSDEKEGGDDYDDELKKVDTLPPSGVLQSAYTLNESLKKFDYYYRVAQIRSNLRRAGKNIDEFSKGYEDMRADAIAMKIDSIKREYNEKMTLLADPNLSYRDWLDTKPTLKKATMNTMKKIAEAKINFWRTVEAIDEYMRVFTSELVKNPDDIKDIKGMLDDTTVFSKWYKSSHGKALHELFDSFPAMKASTGQTYDKLEFLMEEYLKSSEDKHYYEVIDDNKQKAGKQKISNLNIKTVNTIVMNGDSNPFMFRPVVLGDNLKLHDDFSKKAKIVSSDMLVLKNLMSIFSYVGSKFGGKSLFKSVFMSPTLIYKNLCEFLECSAFVMAFNKNSLFDTLMGNLPVAATTQAHEYDCMKNFGIAIKSIFSTNDTDEMFVKCIKSLCAKVLVVTGLYNELERPDEPHYMSPIRMILGAGHETPYVDEAAIELYMRLPLLAEFYRDLFAFNGEPYADDHNNRRSFINMNDPPGTYNVDVLERISMLPETDSKFSGLVKMIFRKNANLSLHDYSDEDTKELVAEMNNIYSQYGKRESLVRDVIDDFVTDMNMRYGTLLRQDQKVYKEELQQKYDYADLDVKPDIERDIPILPDEERDRLATEAPNPSRKYESASLGLGSDDLEVRQRRHLVLERHNNLVYRFRCLLDRFFRERIPEGCMSMSPDYNKKMYTAGSREFSFKPVIKSAQTQLKMDKDKESRFKVVSNLLRGSDAFGKIDQLKYLMFHETVVSGLNTLSAIHTVLVEFQRKVLGMDLKEIVRLLRSSDGDLKNIRLGMEQFKLKPPNSSLSRILDSINKLLNKKYFNSESIEYIKFPADLSVASGTKVVPTGDSKKNEEALVQILDSPNTNIYAKVYEDLMERLIDLVHSISSKDLVQCKFEDGRFSLNFSKLQSEVESMFECLRHYLDIFRPLISKEVFQKYVDKTQPGSYYWLQEQLMEKLFIGREPEVSQGFSPYVNLSRLNMIINDTFKYLNKCKGTWNVLFDPKYGQLFAKSLFYDARFEESGLLYNGDKKRVNTKQDNMESLLVQNLGDKIKVFGAYSFRYTSLYSSDKGDLREGARSLMLSLNQLLARYIDQFYDKSTKRIYKGLVDPLSTGVLNKLVSDPETNAYPDYSYVNGAIKKDALSLSQNAKEIMKPESLLHDNTIPSSGTTFGRRQDPKEDQVVLASLARMINNILNSKNPNTQMNTVMLDNIADVPMFMRENYRANLPIFRQLLKALVGRSMLLKQVLNDNELSMERELPIFPPANTNEGTDKLKDPAADSTTSKQYFSQLIDNVVSSVNLMLSAIEKVLRELGDEPKYLETHMNSIQEYRSLHGHDPLMPLSSALLTLKNVSENANEANGDISHTLMLPVHMLGSDEFKFNYGVRQLLNSPETPVQSDSAPGFKQILDMFNLAVGDREQINDSKALSCMKCQVSLIRYLHGMKHHKGNTTNVAKNVSLSRVDLVETRALDALVHTDTKVNRLTKSIFAKPPPLAAKEIDNVPVYPIRHTLHEEITLTESSFKKRMIQNIVDSIHMHKLGGDFPTLRVMNLLDLNIIPINVHAMMRSVPLANLYNYAYTFDRLLIDMFYGINSDMANMMISYLCGQENSTVLPPNNNIHVDPHAAGQRGKANQLGLFFPSKDTNIVRSSKELFIALMLNPYKELGDVEYQLLDNIMRGDSNVPLGRPKFLSDQVFNKVLLGSMYGMNVSLGMSYKESGPSSLSLARLGLISSNPSITPPDSLNYLKVRGDDYDDKEFDVGTSGNNTVRGLNKLGKTSLSTDDVNKLHELGHNRADSVLIRNLIFLVNAFRMLRLKLRSDLMYNKKLLSKSHAVIRDDLTEFRLNQTQKDVNMADEFNV